MIARDAEDAEKYETQICLYVIVPYLSFELLVDLIAIGATTPLRMRIHPIPQNSIFRCCVFGPGPFGRLHHGTNNARRCLCGTDPMFVRIREPPFAE